VGASKKGRLSSSSRPQNKGEGEEEEVLEA
jgi:hypothetical protein